MATDAIFGINSVHETLIAAPKIVGRLSSVITLIMVGWEH
jgi:hypothetical protein